MPKLTSSQKASREKAIAQGKGSSWSIGSSGSASSATPTTKPGAGVPANTASDVNWLASQGFLKDNSSTGVQNAISTANTANATPTPITTPTTIKPTPLGKESMDTTGYGLNGLVGKESADKTGYGLGVSNGGVITGNETENKYNQALTTLGNTPAPVNSEEGRTGVTTALSTIPDTGTSPAVSSFLDTLSTGEDKDWQAILDTQKAYEEESYTSLQDTYNQLTKDSGIEAIDTTLMNMKNVIEGTEDDIRLEVEKASGFATDSQVLAMATARNKSLIKNYNNLLDQRNAIESHIDKQMAFAGQDKTNALNAINQRMNFQMKVIEYKDKAQSNAREALNNVVKTVGYAGLSQMVGTDPRYISKAESILGLAPGGLTQLATIDSGGDFQFISGTENQPMGVFDKNTGTFKSLGGGGGGSTPNMAGLTPEQQADPFIQKMLASKGGKPLTDSFAQQLNKGLTVLGQVGLLQANINGQTITTPNGVTIEGMKTGPLVGLFRGANPWDTKAQTIKAQLNAIIPNLARGVYGEVGVLTDNDIAQYSKTLPNLTSTEDIRNAVLGITVDMIGRAIKQNLEVNAANQKDVSGFIDIYTNMINTRDSIFSQIPGYKGNTVGQVELTPEDNALADSVLGSASTTPATGSGGSWWENFKKGLGF